MSVQTLNSNAEALGRHAALFMNINAAKGLFDVMKTNLGPKGTLKMLVSGAGDIKLTKDGNNLLREMQITNPTAVMIARLAVAQDDETGDGTTTSVLFIGGIMREAERYILSENVHPTLLVEGLEKARLAAIEFLDQFKTTVDVKDRNVLRAVASTALHTKLAPNLAEQLTDIVTDAVQLIHKEDAPLDLNMVEIMHMRHKLETDTRLVRGLVLDHGPRHPDMPRHVTNAYILTANIGLEFEKSEVASGFFYSSADQREKLVQAERAVTDDRARAVVALKEKVCKNGEGFVLLNQKGIDGPCLDILAAAGIMALRRAKKRNMERLSLACGGYAVNSVEDLVPEALGKAEKVYEHILGDERYTFVEDCAHPQSCTILLKGPSNHAIAQLKDATRDGLRAVKNTLQDACVIPGAGAFEVAASEHVRKVTRKQVSGRAKLGVDVFAEALLTIPKILAENSGCDAQEAVISLVEGVEDGQVVGLDVQTGLACDVVAKGIYDNYCVKKQVLLSGSVVAQNLLLVDEVIRAGVNMRKK